ncbi:Uncharacterized conserved protein YbjQ, UPF0145 family [Mesonia phycicola]|uniref:Uncharacterized conserved protein YbjQ, UPF0145 family n=1 Tax=Mesonia phycicola TaxID=579105 RepID=A0A1M6HP37_9FLAO|nr:YbjQ family protein [Mesonia phycicola]SHJ23918.1 Uncharacterized conserved protein YbjQ, UPF0145 family [Mesonia phycicola]
MEHFKHIKVTTTSSLQNVEIEEYIEPISVSIVIGMNFFKDFLSGFRDIFGGKSNTYTKSLEKINQQAIYELKKRAHYLKANYVIGLTIENDEIAAQGKSMLMVTAMGTAVRVARQNKEVINNSTSIDLEAFEQLELKTNFLKKAENDNLNLSENNWNLIIENQISELSSFLLNKLTENPNSTDFKDNLKAFFENIDRELATTEIFTFLENNGEKDLKPVFNIAKELNLVDFDKNLLLLSSDNQNLNNIGALISGVHKKTYFKSDIKAIKETIDKLESKFPIKVEFYQTLDNLTRKDIEVWKCECGKENSLEREICRGCNKDIHGLKNSNINLKEIKENLKHRLEILEKNFA